MKNLNAAENWLAWLRACLLDPGSPIRLPRPEPSNRGPRSQQRPTAVLGMITGQDMRALHAVAACWTLYAGADHHGQAAALISIRALLHGMQSQCHMFARELIAQSMEWSDRDRVWPMVMHGQTPPPRKSLAECLEGVTELFQDPHRNQPPPMVGGALLTHGRVRTVTVSKTDPEQWLCNSCLAIVPGTKELADREASQDPAPCPECAGKVLCACRDCLELVPVVQGWPTMDERVRACHSAGYGFKLKKAGG